MDDLDTLRQAQILLGQYGFDAEQEAVGKAIRIISATARRLGVTGRSPAPPPPRPPPAHEAPGDRLRRLRERIGLSRAEIADMCGVLMSTVRSHENGQGDIPFEAAQAYARALGTTTSMILSGAE